jgi:hypothetical protein
MGRAQAVPTRHVHVESGGAQARSGMGLGCLDREARRGARAPTCTRRGARAHRRV